jgi:hypothetical protein
LSSGAHSNTIDLFSTASLMSGTLLFKWYHQGSPEILIFRPIIFLRGEQSNGFQRCPSSSSAHSNAIEPLPKVSPTLGTLVCLWYHRGGHGKTKFPSIIFLRGESEKKTRQSNWLSGRLPSSSAHSDAIDPFPKVSPMSGTLVCLWYHWGGAEILNFRQSYFKGRIRKKNSTIKLVFSAAPGPPAPIPTH